MTAQSVVLDQGNIFFRHLVENAQKNMSANASSDEGDDDDDDDDHDDYAGDSDSGDERRTTVGKKTGLDTCFADQQDYQREEGDVGAGHGQLQESDVCPVQTTAHGTDTRYMSMEPVEGGKTTDSGTADLNICREKNSSREANQGFPRRSGQQRDGHGLPSESEPTPSAVNRLALADDKDDDTRDDSDEVDEDDEDRLPGLARAHLNYSDEDVQQDEEENIDLSKERGDSEESTPISLSTAGQTDARSESDIGGKLSNPDVEDTSKILDTVRDINVCSLGQLQRLNKNEPAVKRLLVRPRLSTREVKAIRLDPDIKAIVDDFLRTNITGDFTIARVLRENYASFHPWLASHIQAERNAWAVRLRQAMDAGERTRRDGLDSAALVLEAGLRLRELVQTSSNCMYGHSKTTAPGSTRKGGLGKTLTTSTQQSLKSQGHGQASLPSMPSPNKSCKSDLHLKDPNLTSQQQQQQQQMQNKTIQRSELKGAQNPGALPHSDTRAQGAGSIFRLNGLAKASLASGVNVSALNQKLVRLTTIVDKDKMKDSLRHNKAETGLTPSPMNMLRVEDADISNYESDPGVYSPASDRRHEKRRVRRGLPERYLNRKRTKFSTNATSISGASTSDKLSGVGAPPNYIIRTMREIHQKDKPKKSTNHWCMTDIETLMARELGAKGDCYTKENGTDWPRVIRDNLDVLTDLCCTLVTERMDCLDILDYQSAGESSSLVFALQEYLRARQDSEEQRQEEMEYQLQQLENENQALQAEVSVLKKALSSSNEDMLTLRQQISRLEAMANGVLPVMVNKCVGTGDSLPSLLPKPRMLGGNGGASNRNSFNPFSTLHTATLVYAGAGPNSRYAVKATLAKGRRKRDKTDKALRRVSHHYSDASDSELIEEETRQRRNTNPKFLLQGMPNNQSVNGERTEDFASIVSAPAVAVVVPQIRLGLASQEPSLVETSEEKIRTIKQRAQRLENSLQDALSNMENVKKATPRTDNDSRSSISSTSTSTCGQENKQPNSGRKSARQQPQKETPRFWTEASFEVNGSPPPSSNNNYNHTKNSEKTKDKNSNYETTKTPRSGPLAVIKRPPDFCHVSGHLQERRAASETLPFTLEHEKSSLLSGRALPLSSDKAVLQAAPRQRASPASVISSTSNKEKGKPSKNSKSKSSPHDDSSNSKSENQNATGKLPATISNDNINNKVQHSSFYSNMNPANKQALSSKNGNKSSHKEAEVMAENKKMIPRSKVARAGGVVAKCLRCQKLFNSVDNHKLACCYHPKEKARFEHYDGSGRLVAVVHAWQCCQQPQDADGCCFGQHV